MRQGRRRPTIAAIVSSLARVVHVILLGLWLGAGVFLMAVVAPDIFRVLPGRTDAGNLIAEIVRHFDLFGVIAGPLLLLTLLIGWLPMGTRVRLRLLAILLMTAGTAASGYWITPRMQALRASLGQLERADLGSPLLVEFGNLHLVSTAIMAIHTTLALLLLATAVLSSTPKRRFGIEL